MTDTIRLQKYLAERGVASRRHAGEIIRDGRVKVNNTVVREPGHPVAAGDRVLLDNALLPSQRETTRTIMLHKPRGYICSTQAQSASAKTIYDLLIDIPERLVPAGRLDKDSEGLLLLSNDGDLIERLTHPQHGHSKVYEVSVSGKTNQHTISRLRSRLIIDGYRIQPAEVAVLDSQPEKGRTKLRFTLVEGRSRQIRKMCALTELRVHRLKRVAISGLPLASLPVGAWRDLTANELTGLT